MTRTDLEAVGGRPLGPTLVEMRRISPEQLSAALRIHRDLRSQSRRRKAFALADLADISRGRVIGLAEALCRRSATIRRETTGEGHPAVGVPEVAG